MSVTLFIYLQLLLYHTARLDVAVLSALLARLGSWVINISNYISYV